MAAGNGEGADGAEWKGKDSLALRYASQVLNMHHCSSIIHDLHSYSKDLDFGRL